MGNWIQHNSTVLKSLFICFSYCNEHALRATLARNKQNSKNQPPRTAEVLLSSLSHYIKKPKNHTVSTSYSEDERITSEESTELKTTKFNDPFGKLNIKWF